jgi:hypothetical protein
MRVGRSKCHGKFKLRIELTHIAESFSHPHAWQYQPIHSIANQALQYFSLEEGTMELIKCAGSVLAMDPDNDDGRWEQDYFPVAVGVIYRKLEYDVSRASLWSVSSSCLYLFG